MTKGEVRRISPKHEVAYLRALAETGNASLAAARAGVSRDWAYKRRLVNPSFAGRCREMLTMAKARLLVRVNRPRSGGWNSDREERFLTALAATGDVEVAAGSAGITLPSAYRHRAVRPAFAARWAEALAAYGPDEDAGWIESAACFFEGETPDEHNAVRVTSVRQVLRMLARSERSGRGDS